LEEITFSDIQNIPEKAQESSNTPYSEISLLEAWTYEVELDAQLLIAGPTLPDGPLYRDKNANDLDTLSMFAF